MSAILDTREGRIVIRARLYALLADHEEYMRADDVAARIARTSSAAPENVVELRR